MEVQTLKVNQKGMITIPVDLRRKYQLKEGSEITIVDLESNLIIIPIFKEFKEVQAMLSTRDQIMAEYETNRQMELIQENE